MFSTLHTIDASKTVERIIGTFEAGEQQGVRTRLASSFRCIISQKLIPRQGGGRIALLEMLKSTMRTRDYMQLGESEGKTLLDAMRDGELDGCSTSTARWRSWSGRRVSMSTALLYATNPGNLQVQLADMPAEALLT